jgi:hypothetical protein
MTSFIAEDIRKMLNKLSEADANKPADETGTDSDVAADKEDAPPNSVDDVLSEPAGLEKIVGNLNVQALMDILEIPKDTTQATNFKSAINALKQEDPILTTPQAMALAMAFDHILTTTSTDRGKISAMLKPVHGAVEEESNGLDMKKIKGFMAKSGMPGHQDPGNDEDKMIATVKGAVAATKKFGSHSDKKELGLLEQNVDVITYNSGHGEQLDIVANDPKRRKTVELVQLRMTPNGRPEIVWRDRNGADKYIADWNDKYGWVADFD